MSDVCALYVTYVPGVPCTCMLACPIGICAVLFIAACASVPPVDTDHMCTY